MEKERITIQLPKKRLEALDKECVTYIRKRPFYVEEAIAFAQDHGFTLANVKAKAPVEAQG